MRHCVKGLSCRIILPEIKKPILKRSERPINLPTILGAAGKSNIFCESGLWAMDRFLSGEIDVDTAAIPSMERLDTHARQAITSAIHDEMKAALRGVTEDDHVVIPFHAQIARAERGKTWEIRH
jgi:hypothetical protein